MKIVSRDNIIYYSNGVFFMNDLSLEYFVILNSLSS